MSRNLVFEASGVALYVYHYVGFENEDCIQLEFIKPAAREKTRSWSLDRTSAERLCLHILTHFPDDYKDNGLLVTSNPKNADFWKISSGYVLVTTSANNAEYFWTRYWGWRQKVAEAKVFPRSLLGRPSLDDEIAEYMYEAQLDSADATRMALSILEAIGRSAWISALRITWNVQSEPSLPQLALGEVIGSIVTAGLVLGLARACMWAIDRWITPLTITFTDVVLMAILLAGVMVGSGVGKSVERLWRYWLRFR